MWSKIMIFVKKHVISKGNCDQISIAVQAYPVFKPSLADGFACTVGGSAQESIVQMRLADVCTADSARFFNFFTQNIIAAFSTLKI